MARDKKPKAIKQPENETNFQNATLLSYINTWDKLNIVSLLVCIIAIITILAVGVDECRRCFKDLSMVPALSNSTLSTSQSPSYSTPRRYYWTYLRKKDDGHLKHVYKVLDAMGYTRIQDQTQVQNWDLLWAHDYPFLAQYDRLKQLRSHQKVNHLPGCGYLTTKVELATTRLKYILPAFRLPKEKDAFLNYTRDHPRKQFVLKDNEHRRIRVEQVKDIDVERNGSFAQVFLDNPLLVSGHMFDIGIYTIITSIDPLRIYIYNGDVLLRFCPQKFKPFDPTNLDKYVVGDDYLPIWEVPKIQYWYKKLGYGMRDSLTAYLADEGRDASVIWRQIEEAIALAVLAKQPQIMDVVKRFRSKRNFFEMMRFDFLVDAQLGVHLLEANMSPNLSSAHFRPNQLLYEQVLFNLFGLVGVGERLIKGVNNREMETSEKNLLVTPNMCSSAICRQSCDELDCRLCKYCLQGDTAVGLDEQDLRDAHREHLNRGDCKRIFPPTMVAFRKLPAAVASYPSVSNQLMYLWFQEKCNMDHTWC